MTRDDVLLIIEKTKERDKTICKERGRYQKIDLCICLTFMYYSHLKMVDTLRLTPESIEGNLHRYYSDKYKSEMEFEMPKTAEFKKALLYFLYMHGRAREAYLIKNKKRALIAAFNQIAKENDIIGCRITDVYKAGLKDNADIRKPYKVGEVNV